MGEAGSCDPARPGAVAGSGLSVYSAEAAAVICRRVAAGESVRAICEDPPMPHRTTLQRWMRAHPEFQQALAAAMRTARRDVRMADRQRLAEQRARPPSPKGTRQSEYTPELGEDICRRLGNGEALTAIARDPDMPCYHTILGWVRRHEDFQEMYVTARQIQADYLFDEARDVAKAATPGDVWVGRLQFDVIRWQSARLAPKKYSESLMVRTAASEAQAARVAAQNAPQKVTFYTVDFQVGDDGRVFAVPPRNPQEHAMYEAKYGHPYEDTLKDAPRRLQTAEAP